MNLAVAIMAAGAASRFGGCKHVALLGGESLLARQIQLCQDALSCDVTVITGCHHQPISNAVGEDRCLFNPNWQQGLGNSIAFAATQLQQAEALAIVLADQVLLTVDDLQQLKYASEAAPITCATYDKRRSVPAIFHKQYFPELQQLNGDQGAKALLHKATEIATVEMANASFDVDTAEQLAQAHLRLGLS